jgi:hypothetical protein
MTGKEVQFHEEASAEYEAAFDCTLRAVSWQL